MIDGLLVALGFLTRLPVPAAVFARPQAQSRSLPWYPLVGLLVGALLAALAWLLRDSGQLLSAGLVVAAWSWLTGGLHLDGLADSADAWVGGMGDRARTLEIMKDPRSGPAGVTAVVLVLLVKFAALASLPAPASLALLAAPMLARAALTGAFLVTPYVRPGGLGAGLAPASKIACGAAVLLAVLATAMYVPRGGWVLLVTIAVFWLCRRACMRRLGGMTGDTCGALAELMEVAVLVTLAV